MSRTPEISTVITFFREGEILKETIESALDQTNQDFEVLLVDNNADAQTRKVAESFVCRFPRIVRLVHEPIQGIAASKNRGLYESRGEFIALLDGDDLMLPERLARQREAFQENPRLSLVSTWYDRISMDNRTIVRKNVSQTEGKLWQETQRILKDLYPCSKESGRGESLHFPLPSSIFFRRQTALDAGGFNNAFNPRWCEEFEFFLRMHEKGEFYKVPESLVRYRVSSPEAMKIKMQQIDWVGISRHMDLLYRVLWENFGHKSPNSKEIFRRLRALWFRHESFNFFRYENGTSLGKKLLVHSLKANPTDLDTWKLWIKAQLPKMIHPQLFWFDELLQEPLPEGANHIFVDGLFSNRK